MSRVANFVGDQVLTRFTEFSSSIEEGVAFVIACCFEVEEGVDMWFAEDSIHFDPRFRLKIRVGNVAEEKIFLLCDDLVKTIAPYTCELLMSLDEGSSLYPNEIDDLFGDPIIFKVNKKWKDGVESVMVYEVMGLMTDPSLINIYVNPSHSAYGCLQPVQDSDANHAYPVQIRENCVVVVGNEVQKVAEVIARERVVAEGSKRVVEKDAEPVLVEPHAAEVPKHGTKRKLADSYVQAHTSQSKFPEKIVGVVLRE